MIAEFTVDRLTWLRGESSYDSRLIRRTDNKRCCLGFLGKESGVPDYEMLEKCSLDEINWHVDDLIDSFGPLVQETNENKKGINGTLAAYLLMNVNDAPLGFKVGNNLVLRSEEQREAMLTDQFKELGITVRFIN